MSSFYFINVETRCLVSIWSSFKYGAYLNSYLYTLSVFSFYFINLEKRCSVSFSGLRRFTYVESSYLFAKGAFSKPFIKFYENFLWHPVISNFGCSSKCFYLSFDIKGTFSRIIIHIADKLCTLCFICFLD